MQPPNNRASLESQLGRLENSLLDLASMVEKAVSQSMLALKNHDHRVARQVIKADRPINARRYDIENDALLLLALQQPVLSRDLRYIAAVMHIAGELERMGDYAKGIARISDKITADPPLSIVLKLEEMSVLSNQMLHEAMGAFIDNNVEEADRIAAQDDELDDSYNQVYRELLNLMLGDNSQIDMATLLLWAAHNIERMGDRVTNICERIRFVETGVMGDAPGIHDTNAD